MNSFWAILGIGAAASFVLMNIGFVLAVRLKDNSIVDVLWGLSFIAAAIGAHIAGNHNDRSILVTGLVVVWGLRLAGFIFVRKLGDRREDPRYAKWRKQWGDRWLLRSWLQVFMFQWLLANIIVVAAPLVAWDPHVSGLGWLDWVGVGVWAFGVLFEAIGDDQKRRWHTVEHPKGEVMQSGLWRYTRHPNYFGESVTWLGIAIVSLSATHGWIGLLGFVLVTVLVRWVSGVTHLEKPKWGDPQWDAYAARTNAFIPGPRRAG